ncbi:MAG: hypothetical protein ABIB12_02675 [Patescibacteria group bacterium]
MEIRATSPKEQEIRALLGQREDPEAKRLVRFLNMPDLSRTPGSPIAELVSRILKIPRFSDFDHVQAPEIVPADVSFDLFNFPKDHPVRSTSDTYYVRDQILRTHTTVMWYYQLQEQAVRNKIEKRLPIGALSWGKVYRKDEIDRKHMNVFHQMDGWYLVPKSTRVLGVQDLQDVLAEIAQAIYGKDIQYRFNKDSFPYTDPSIEMEILRDDRWIEVLGSGIVHPAVLRNFGVSADEYNGWAFGFGLERLALLSMNLPDIRLLWSEDPRVKKQLHLDQKYVEVSKYPLITRDISFVVGQDFVPNNYFDLLRDIGGELVEEVQLIDKYEDEEKFGKDKVSYTWHIVYRSTERTLTNEEVDKLQQEVYKQTAQQFGAQLR